MPESSKGIPAKEVINKTFFMQLADSLFTRIVLPTLEQYKHVNLPADAGGARNSSSLQTPRDRQRHSKDRVTNPAGKNSTLSCEPFLTTPDNVNEAQHLLASAQANASPREDYSDIAWSRRQ